MTSLGFPACDWWVGPSQPRSPGPEAVPALKQEGWRALGHFGSGAATEDPELPHACSREGNGQWQDPGWQEGSLVSVDALGVGSVFHLEN